MYTIYLVYCTPYYGRHRRKKKNKAKHGKMRWTPKTVKIATSEIQYLNF